MEEDRIRIFQGSQIDKVFLDKVVSESGDLDVIIDDGSHINDHVIQTFQYLFPKLKKGGVYVIEDTQISYWDEYGGSSSQLNKEGTIYNFFKSLIDALNNEELVLEGYEKSYYDKYIISMHFYHNLIFVYKGDNDELSNKVYKNKFN